jgi:phosphoglycerol transferase
VIEERTDGRAPQRSTNNHAFGRSLLLFAGTGLISFIAFLLAFRLWHADLNVPFSYAWYADAIEPRTKELLDGTWFWNPSLGAPFGQNAIAIIQLDTLKWAVQWVLVEITRNPFLTQNLFEMLDPILGSMTFLYAALRLGIGAASGVPCAILYGNLFVLYWRILAGHAIPAAYWMTPLACLSLLQIARGEALTKRDYTVLLVTAFLIGMESHYDAFFTGFLALAALVIGCVQRRSFEALRTARAFLVVMTISFAVNASPTVIWSLVHNQHVFTYARNPVEAYLYSLSIGQLILPNQFHRLALFAHVRQAFDNIFPALSNENNADALGVAGTFGLFVLAVAIIARGAWQVPRYVEHSGYLTFAAIALATTGGLGAIFNRFVTADVRAYNRISPWIAFFCLIGVAWILQLTWESLERRKLGYAYAAIACVIAVAGVLDQSPDHPPPFALSRERVTEDRAWTRQIEAAVPAGSAILELPYVENYEAPLAASEQVPYLYSRRLRWSVGQFGGLSGARFERRLAALPPNQIVGAALRSGFDGILIFRADMPGKEADFESQLIMKTHREPIVSPGGGQAFFPLDQLKKTVP